MNNVDHKKILSQFKTDFQAELTLQILQAMIAKGFKDPNSIVIGFDRTNMEVYEIEDGQVVSIYYEYGRFDAPRTPRNLDTVLNHTHELTVKFFDLANAIHSMKNSGYAVIDIVHGDKSADQPLSMNFAQIFPTTDLPTLKHLADGHMIVTPNPVTSLPKNRLFPVQASNDDKLDHAEVLEILKSHNISDDITAIRLLGSGKFMVSFNKVA